MTENLNQTIFFFFINWHDTPLKKIIKRDVLWLVFFQK